VAIATVLSLSPDTLVMDEPTTGLDPFARRMLIGLLREFHHTKIFTSHDLGMVLDLCERTIVLHEGIGKADGPSMEIFRDEELVAECRLEKPISMQNYPVCGSG
jgi:cobalt/nickel transport system ATP-binding protein